MTHTKGKWIVQVGRGNGEYFVTSENGIVQPEEQEANANLIASAPDLLAGLKLMIEGCRERNFIPVTCDIAEQAIIKAKGGKS